MEKTDHFECLRSTADHHMVGGIFRELLKEFPQFEWWAGSHNKMCHHYERGGLVRHTNEIVELGLHAIPTLNLQKKVDPTEFYLAALFHDTGKLFDYEYVGFDQWKPTQHRRLIHHLPRSCIIWHDIAREFPGVMKKYHDSVLHAILAHHGRRDAGSPVAPLTHVAWLLHLCDGISARMDDAEKMDIVAKP